jgi:molybdopterin converting factor small subunit
VAEVTVTSAPKATIEVTTWVSRYVGGDGAGSKLFEEPLARGETVGEILRRYSARYPELDAALWNPTRTALGEHIEVLVNDAVLGVGYDLDTRLVGGERITLLGQFMGG